MAVDHRPSAARNADQIVVAALLGIVGCGILGAGLAVKAVLFLTTTPHKETP